MHGIIYFHKGFISQRQFCDPVTNVMMLKLVWDVKFRSANEYGTKWSSDHQNDY